MNPFTLRDARIEDKDAIRTLTLAANEQYAKVAPAGWEDYRQNILTTLADVLPAEQIVAERNSIIVGTVLMYPADTVFTLDDGTAVRLKSPEVRLLAVAPAARKQGIGRALMRECIERARRAGSSALTLHTTDLMQVAMQMYEHMGFVRAPELDFEPTPGFVVKGYRFLLFTVPGS